jgi:hypothetical protein
MELATSAALVSVAGGLFAIYFGMARTKKAQDETAERSGALYSDVGYIKSGIDDLKRKQEKAEERYLELAMRVTSVEESAKQAHKRIDCIEGK